MIQQLVEVVGSTNGNGNEYAMMQNTNSRQPLNKQKSSLHRLLGGQRADVIKTTSINQQTVPEDMIPLNDNDYKDF
jgi:hypothetical protein